MLKRNGYTSRIEEYRLLWLQLNRLIRECGSCNSYIVSLFIITNIFCLVVVTYDVAFALWMYILAGRTVEFLDGLVLVYVWWTFVYIYCDAGFRMMESVSGIELVISRMDPSCFKLYEVSGFLGEGSRNQILLGLADSPKIYRFFRKLD